MPLFLGIAMIGAAFGLGGFLLSQRPEPPKPQAQGSKDEKKG